LGILGIGTAHQLPVAVPLIFRMVDPNIPETRHGHARVVWV
jgi:hypothetical protein